MDMKCVLLYGSWQVGILAPVHLRICTLVWTGWVVEGEHWRLYYGSLKFGVKYISIWQKVPDSVHLSLVTILSLTFCQAACVARRAYSVFCGPTWDTERGSCDPNWQAINGTFERDTDHVVPNQRPCRSFADRSKLVPDLPHSSVWYWGHRPAAMLRRTGRTN